VSSEIVESLKRNWFLGATAAGCVVLGIAIGFREGTATASDTPNRTEVYAAAPSYAHVSPVNSGGTPWAKLQTKEQQVKSDIQEYQHKIYEEAPTEETDMDMMRLGNLYYSKLQEYDDAATCYEMLLKKYPDFEMASIVFQNLSECYKRLGDTPSELNTYRRMMQRFPEGTNENAYASHKLGL
jgi:tetratricopeptide (TPR) repeat protein